MKLPAHQRRVLEWFAHPTRSHKAADIAAGLGYTPKTVRQARSILVSLIVRLVDDPSRCGRRRGRSRLRRFLTRVRVPVQRIQQRLTRERQFMKGLFFELQYLGGRPFPFLGSIRQCRHAVHVAGVAALYLWRSSRSSFVAMTHCTGRSLEVCE